MSMRVKNINCQHLCKGNLCNNDEVDQMFCMEQNYVACKFKKPWPKPAPPPPPPKHNINVGLKLKCNVCSCLLNTPGTLLFSPPKGNIVKKYHV